MRNCRFAFLFALVSFCLAAGLSAKDAEAARAAGVKSAPAAAVDVVLDGSDWRMTSFEFGGGLKAGADKEAFDDGAFKAVTVPGDTQLQAGFTGAERWSNSKDLIAVNAHEWWYRKHFHAPPRAAGAVTRIVFDGVDYFATVWLNGQLLGTHEGTNPAFSFDVTDKLRYGADNLLAVLVTHPWIPPDGRGALEYLNGGFSLAIAGEALAMKKPPYFIAGIWDALPAQGTSTYDMGIWRSVHLRTSGPVTVSDLHVETQTINAGGSATLAIGVTLQNDGNQAATRTVALKLQPDNFTGPAQDLAPLTIVAAPGTTTAKMEIQVPHAQLWWSWDHGPQNLYRLDATIAAAQDAWGDRRSVTFGIRTVTRDASMAYWLNGKKIFAKATWFPIEDFYRSTPAAEDYERDLRLLRDGNFNMLVNYTVLEKPPFYDLCDRLGILVVTQLPFSQFGGYELLDRDNPRREPFLKQARLQVSAIITTLRNHPSIVEWAPLAEAHEKAGGWGPGGTGVDQQGYDNFIAQMKAVVTELAPGAIFHPSLCDLGEQHFWYAGAGAVFEGGTYQDFFDAKTGFVSEYGGTSLSSLENIGKYLTPAQQWGAKTKLPRWFNLPIDNEAYAYLTSFDANGLYNMLYRTEHFIDRDPRTLAELVSDTQLYQGFMLKYAAEAFRRKKYDPINGIRNWDFLELDPGFRFGIVDYDRVPKLGYYYLKQTQAPVALSFAYKDVLESQVAGSPWSAPIWLVNDTENEVLGTVRAELLSLAGEKLAAADLPALVAADRKGIVGNFSLTLPRAAGVYILRASLNGAEAPVETSYIKVAPPAFSTPHRILLIAQSKSAEPIARMLRAMGLAVDTYDENTLDAMSAELADGATLHQKYDAVWIGCFEALAKVLPPQTAQAIEQAVKAGTGFIITGGDGGFHGGLGHAAVVEGTGLNAILPVEIAGRADLIFGAHGMDDALATENPIHEIDRETDAAQSEVSVESAELLRHYGLPAFNEVAVRAGARAELTIAGEPLLVTGMHGAGKTAAFTGFTPVSSAASALSMDQYLMAAPQARAYFALFADMLAGVLPGSAARAADILTAHEKPLFQTLKEQPQTELVLTESETTSASCRVRVANRAGYAHLVHLRVEWAQSGPKPFLTELSDNDFELMPGESREIVLTWKNVSGDRHAAGTLIGNAANAPEVRLAF